MKFFIQKVCGKFHGDITMFCKNKFVDIIEHNS